MKSIYLHIIITLLYLTAASVPLAAQQDYGKESGRDTTDSRPLLMKIFSDFPTLYTDTTYRDTSFRVVIRATLFNNKWHRHHSETRAIITETSKGDSVSGNRKRKPPMVIFIKRKI